MAFNTCCHGGCLLSHLRVQIFGKNDLSVCAFSCFLFPLSPNEKCWIKNKESNWRVCSIRKKETNEVRLNERKKRGSKEGKNCDKNRMLG